MGFAIAPLSLPSNKRGQNDRSVLCEDIAELAQIYADDVNVCVYARDLSDPLREAARELAAPGSTQARTLVLPANPDWRDLLPAGLSAGARDVLTAELNYLTRLVADLLGDAADGEVGVRLSCSDRPPCPRFHVDRVHARLVTTWLGAGTEWLENGDCDRRLLGTPETADSESGLIRNAARIGQASQQAIVILKGEAWPGFTGRGAVHRSPAFVGPRVMVTLEPL